MVPKNTSNDRDWRLYQELAAQADLILSTGRILARLGGRARPRNFLQTEQSKIRRFARRPHRTRSETQPDIAIISSSLDFSATQNFDRQWTQGNFFHQPKKPNAKRVREIESQAGPVIVAGKKSVSGALLKQRIQASGYQTVYSAAGPQVLHLLLEGDVLDRLYMTFANRILGGEEFDYEL